MPPMWTCIFVNIFAFLSVVYTVDPRNVGFALDVDSSNNFQLTVQSTQNLSHTKISLIDIYEDTLKLYITVHNIKEIIRIINCTKYISFNGLSGKTNHYYMPFIQCNEGVYFGSSYKYERNLTQLDQPVMGEADNNAFNIFNSLRCKMLHYNEPSVETILNYIGIIGNKREIIRNSYYHQNFSSVLIKIDKRYAHMLLEDLHTDLHIPVQSFTPVQPSAPPLQFDIDPVSYRTSTPLRQNNNTGHRTVNNNSPPISPPIRNVSRGGFKGQNGYTKEIVIGIVALAIVFIIIIACCSSSRNSNSQTTGTQPIYSSSNIVHPLQPNYYGPQPNYYGPQPYMVPTSQPKQNSFGFSVNNVSCKTNSVGAKTKNISTTSSASTVSKHIPTPNPITPSTGVSYSSASKHIPNPNPITPSTGVSYSANASPMSGNIHNSNDRRHRR